MSTILSTTSTDALTRKQLQNQIINNGLKMAISDQDNDDKNGDGVADGQQGSSAAGAASTTTASSTQGDTRSSTGGGGSTSGYSTKAPRKQSFRAK